MGVRRALALVATGLTLLVQAAAAQTVTVRGIAFDSLRNAPLAGGLVWMAERGKFAITDASGRFVFDSVAPGRHSFTLNHDGIDSLGLGSVATKVDVPASGTSIVLAVPSFETLWRAACARKAPRDTLLMYGAVRSTGEEAPVAGASVEVSWHDFDVTGRRQVVEKARTLVSLTDANGTFGFCGVPLGVGLSIRAYTENAASGSIALAPSTDRVRWTLLAVGAIAAGDSTHTGTVSGLVQRAGGIPVPDATVAVDGVEGVRTDSAGRFVLPRVPAGTRQLRVLSIGLSEASQTVDVTAGKTAELTFTVQPLTTLDAARVVAPTVYNRIVREIDERRKLGLGKILDSVFVGRRGTMMSVFEEVSGLKVRPQGPRKYILLAKGFSGGDCLANLFIDGVRQFDQETLWLTYPDEIAFVEVYARGMMVPADFMVPRSDCGSVAIWTKRRMP